MTRYRTIFMSDLHLGTRGCQADLMLDFLRHNDADTIYLVGDIIDGWRLRPGWYWPQAHNDVIQKLLRKVRRGARMVFVPGNHDEFARQFIGLTFGGIEIVAQRDPYRPPTASATSSCMATSSTSSCATPSGSPSSATGPTISRCSSTPISTRARRVLGFGYWSFSAWAKLKVKNAVNFIGSFERELAGEAQRARRRRRDLRPHPSSRRSARSRA